MSLLNRFGSNYGYGYNSLHRRLTKLYSDTKQSYESASVVNSNVGDLKSSSPTGIAGTIGTTASEIKHIGAESRVAGLDPDMVALQRDFTIQKDRLLAWGLHWADQTSVQGQSQAQTSGISENGKGGKAGSGGIGVNRGRGGGGGGGVEVEIDRKLDQAGLGDVVAGVMSEIQRLLIESEKVQRDHRQRSKGDKNAWTFSEIATSKELLEQLTTCIDVLYTLSESRKTTSQSTTKVDKETERDTMYEHSSRAPAVNAASRRESQTRPTLQNASGQSYATEKSLYDHPRYIEYRSLNLLHKHHFDATDPPSYDEAIASTQKRLIGTIAAPGDAACVVPIIVEFIPMKNGLDEIPTQLDPEHLDSLAKALDEAASKSQASHTGHVELLGYTIDTVGSRYGFVYRPHASPLPPDPSMILPTPRSLATLLTSRMETSETSSPNLEDRFRLAYNLILSVFRCLIQGIPHGNLNSNNVGLMADSSDDADSQPSSQEVRFPYLFSSAQLFTVSADVKEPLSGSIYRHPCDDRKLDGPNFAAYEIYSLGLILLEAGMWIPLSRLWKSKYDNSTFMSRVKKIYIPKLAGKCGSAYMQVVRKCLDAPEELTVLMEEADPGSKNVVAAEYLLEITKKMATCCAIDIEGPATDADLDFLETLVEQKKSSLISAPRQPPLEASVTLSSMPAEKHDASSIKGSEASLARKAKSHPRSSLRKWNEVDIPQQHLDEWNTILMPRLSKMLQTALQGSPESCSVSLMMVGKSAERAKTTICIQCADVEKVQEVLKRGFRAKKGWGVVVLKGEVRRSGKRRKRKSKTGKQSEETNKNETQESKSYYQERPRCGASIGAFRDNEHMPPVSFGGAILVDGKPFGMTVHHMLDAAIDDEEQEDADTAERCVGRHDERMQLLTTSDDLMFIQSAGELPEALYPFEISEDEESTDDESDSSTIRPDYAAFDEEGNEFWFIDDTSAAEPELEFGSDSDPEYSSEEEDDEGSDEDDDHESIGDIAGVDPNDDDEILVTQPALDDVEEDFFPSMEDRDDDHLASHSLGYVHASSGLRRVVKDGIKHEVDWALIKIREERLEVENTIREEIAATRNASNSNSNSKRSRARRSRAVSSTQSAEVKEEQPRLNGVASVEQLAGAEVFCCGRTSGFQKGRISRAMTLVKMHGRESFSSSWCVEGGFGVPGDSGAWIYNPSTRQLCGHVLAWGSRSKTAYFAPMQVLFEDIKRTLGADEVCLPGPANATMALNGDTETAHPYPIDEDIRFHDERHPDQGAQIDQTVQTDENVQFDEDVHIDEVLQVGQETQADEYRQICGDIQTNDIVLVDEDIPVDKAVQIDQDAQVEENVPNDKNIQTDVVMQIDRDNQTDEVVQIDQIAQTKESLQILPDDQTKKTAQFGQVTQTEESVRIHPSLQTREIIQINIDVHTDKDVRNFEVIKVNEHYQLEKDPRTTKNNSMDEDVQVVSSLENYTHVENDVNPQFPKDKQVGIESPPDTVFQPDMEPRAESEAQPENKTQPDNDTWVDEVVPTEMDVRNNEIADDNFEDTIQIDHDIQDTRNATDNKANPDESNRADKEMTNNEVQMDTETAYTDNRAQTVEDFKQVASKAVQTENGEIDKAVQTTNEVSDKAVQTHEKISDKEIQAQSELQTQKELPTNRYVDLQMVLRGGGSDGSFESEPEPSERTLPRQQQQQQQHHQQQHFHQQLNNNNTHIPNPISTSREQIEVALEGIRLGDCGSGGGGGGVMDPASNSARRSSMLLAQIRDHNNNNNNNSSSSKDTITTMNKNKDVPNTYHHHHHHRPGTVVGSHAAYGGGGLAGAPPVGVGFENRVA